MSGSGDAQAFERCMAVGGLAVFPADTIYGLACDPGNRVAVERLYLLKRRPLSKPSAVMFFDLEVALDALPELGPRTREAMAKLMPGGVTLLLPNPSHRYPLACGDDPDTLGVRVPAVDRLAGVSWPVLQSSANRAGGAEAQRLEDVPELLRQAADLVIDGGELPGTSSTVVDLRRYEDEGSWRIVRQGAVEEDELRGALGGQWHFDPDTYLEMIEMDVPLFERLQDELVAASGDRVERILELGTGTGETARRLLARHAGASLIGVDESERMLAAARRLLPAGRVDLRTGRIQDPLPDGPFDLVASALCVHHLDAEEKADLFTRVRGMLSPGGRFVLADLVLPTDPADARTPYTPGFDKPSLLADQVQWLREAGFGGIEVAWEQGDLAVIVGRA
jgi:tRNA threonylcarbamoyl adenosine modification protein (Sua5/YciO/YrdC/YwlC family)